ncbi:MAG: VWA domain-containing protein [Clostridium sp.]
MKLRSYIRRLMKKYQRYIFLYEIVNVNDSLLEKMIRLSEEVIKDKAEGIEHNIVREMKTNKESALTIAKSGGEIQSVDIQKYMYKKGLQILKGNGINLEDRKKDTDKDGLVDVLEIVYGSDINVRDTDKDGLTDFEEFKIQPFLSLTNPDSDKDGILDGNDDLDGDSLSNRKEYDLGINPLSKDSDNDGLEDGFELNEFKSNPNKVDTDEDGLTDFEEYKLGTDPNKLDTDGDGIPDNNDTYEKESEVGDIKVEIEGNPKALETLNITTVSSDGYLMPGQVSETYSVTTEGKLKDATLKFKVNSTVLKENSIEDLKVVYFDEKDGTIKVSEGEQGFDKNTGVVWAKTNHFTEFSLVNIKTWREKWLDYDVSNRPGSGNEVVYLDCALIIDSSGSMGWNDPENLRVEASKLFVDSLYDKDMAYVIDFDNYGKVYQSLTNDKTLIKKALDRIDDDGGTNISEGLRAAINELKGDRGERSKYAILLTDGDGYYDKNESIKAAEEGIKIYTIGLGKSYDKYVLGDIADKTGGKFFAITTAEELIEIFDRIAGETTGGIDTDGDGLSDKTEESGIRDGRGKLYKTDPKKEDTDGDGIPDGQEVGVRGYEPHEYEGDYPTVPEDGSGVYEYDGGKYFRVISDPTKADSDNDGLLDPVEIEIGFPVFNSDLDGDGLIDKIEYSIGTEPNDVDTDDDHGQKKGKIDLTDKGEYLSSEYDPLAYDEILGSIDYVCQFISGYLCGDFLNDPSITNIVGSITSSFASFGIGDLRDTLAALVKGDFVSLALNLAGLIPAAGDAAQVANKVLKLLDNANASSKVFDALRIVSKWDVISESASTKIMRDVLTKAGYMGLFIEFFYGDEFNQRINVSDEISKIVAILGKDHNIAVPAFHKALEKYAGYFEYCFKYYPDARRLIREALLDPKNMDGVEGLVEQLSIGLTKMQTMADGQHKAFYKRLQGWTCENLTINRHKNAGGKSLLEGKTILEHGPDGIFKYGSEIIVSECKAWKKVVGAKNLPKYLKKEGDKYIFDLDYILKYTPNDKDRISVMNSAKNGDLVFELSTLTQKGSQNIEAGELSKELNELVNKKIQVKYGKNNNYGEVKIEHVKHGR